MIIGVDLGGTSISLGKLSQGKLIEKHSAPTPSSSELEESLLVFKNTIRPYITLDVRGIGIGVPSVVDTQKGIVYNVANIPAWEEVHLKDILEKEFNVPVFLNNDANCFAIGEKRFGSCQAYQNIVGITIGTGVGSGIVINGELYEGVNTGAGEIGEIPYLDGVFEHYCASGFFTKYNTTGKDSAEKAKKGDEEAIQLWHEFGLHFGKLIHTVLLAYDPEAIIFGGSISNAYQLFEAGMKESLQKFPFPKSLEKLDFKISSDPDIAILGAAALVK